MNFVIIIIVSCCDYTDNRPDNIARFMPKRTIIKDVDAFSINRSLIEQKRLSPPGYKHETCNWLKKGIPMRTFKYSNSALQPAFKPGLQ